LYFNCNWIPKAASHRHNLWTWPWNQVSISQHLISSIPISIINIYIHDRQLLLLHNSTNIGPFFNVELSIGSLGSGNSEAYVSGITVNGAKFSGTTNGVRIKTWQVTT
jgi:hypothetical protein